MTVKPQTNKLCSVAQGLVLPPYVPSLAQWNAQHAAASKVPTKAAIFNERQQDLLHVVQGFGLISQRPPWNGMLVFDMRVSWAASVRCTLMRLHCACLGVDAAWAAVTISVRQMLLQIAGRSRAAQRRFRASPRRRKASTTPQHRHQL